MLRNGLGEGTAEVLGSTGPGGKEVLRTAPMSQKHPEGGLRGHSRAGRTRAEGPRGGGAPPRVRISPRSQPFCPAEAAVAPRCPGDRLVLLGRPRCGGCRRAELPRPGPQLSPPRCLLRCAARPPRGLRCRSGTEAGSVTAPRRPSLPPGRGGGTRAAR